MAAPNTLLGQTATTSDDSYTPSLLVSSSQGAAQNQSGFSIQPRANPLDSFSSYTYNVSLYILKPSNSQLTGVLSSGDYQQLVINDGAITLDSEQLLIRSGGSAQGTRNQFFADTDFSIDDVTFTQIPSTKGTGGPVATSEFTMKITEPASITFLDRLLAAVKQFHTDNTSYYQTIYMLAIKFIGYDDAGNVINPQSNINTLKDGSVIEKYIPFIIKNVTFHVGTRVTEYTITGANPGNLVGLSQIKNIAPIHVELSGTTLEELFNAGNPSSSDVYQQTTVDGTPVPSSLISNAPGPSTVFTKGLMRAINDQYAKLVTDGIIEVADTFYVVFDPATNIGASKINTEWLETAGYTDVNDTRAANPKNSNSTQARTKKRWDIQAGQALTQFINQTLLVSDYVKNQSQIQINANNNNSEDATPNPQAQNQKFQWFRIIPQSVPIAFDNKRRAYAYATTYFVTTYQVTDPKVASFNRNPWPGPHKLYKYSFTGQNTQVMKYEQDFNYLYYNVFNDKQKIQTPPVQANPESTQYQPAQQNIESKQGGQQKEADIAASAAGSLYSPSDTAHNKMTIIGDPDLILNETHSINAITTKDPFLTDGTVNSHAGELYYSVFLKKSNDWDPNKGIVNFESNPASIPNFQSVYAAAYIYQTVISHFSRGSFTQEISGYQLLNVDPMRSIIPGDATISTAQIPQDNAAQQEAQQRSESSSSDISSTPDIRTLTSSVPGQAAVEIPNQVPPILGGSSPKIAPDISSVSGIYPNYNVTASNQRLQQSKLQGEFTAPMNYTQQVGDLEA